MGLKYWGFITTVHACGPSAPKVADRALMRHAWFAKDSDRGGNTDNNRLQSVPGRDVPETCIWWKSTFSWFESSCETNCSYVQVYRGNTGSTSVIWVEADVSWMCQKCHVNKLQCCISIYWDLVCCEGLLSAPWFSLWRSRQVCSNSKLKDKYIKSTLQHCVETLWKCFHNFHNETQQKLFRRGCSNTQSINLSHLILPL